MKKIAKGLLWFVKNWEEVIASVGVAVMLVICTYNVIMRYAFNSAIGWSQEVCIIGLVYVSFVGSAAAYKRNSHFGMDFLISHLPQKAQHAVRILLDIMMLVLFSYLTYLSVNYTLAARKLMDISRISFKYLYISAILGFGSMAVYTAIYLAQAIFAPDQYKARYFPAETAAAKPMEAEGKA